MEKLRASAFRVCADEACRTAMELALLQASESALTPASGGLGVVQS